MKSWSKWQKYWFFVIALALALVLLYLLTSSLVSRTISRPTEKSVLGINVLSGYKLIIDFSNVEEKSVTVYANTNVYLQDNGKTFQLNAVCEGRNCRFERKFSFSDNQNEVCFVVMGKTDESAYFHFPEQVRVKVVPTTETADGQKTGTAIIFVTLWVYISVIVAVGVGLSQ